MGASVFLVSSSELAVLSNTFSVGGAPTDPTTVSLVVTTPTGTATTYTYALAEITKTSPGVYTKTIPCTEAGTWQYAWTGTGTASDIQLGTWEVLETAVGKLYCPIDTLKSRLGIPATDMVDDFELHHACFSASRWIEQYCGRHFWRTATGTARTFVADHPYELALPEFHDLVSVSALATDETGDGTYETTWDAADYRLLPYNPSAAPETLPYTALLAVASKTWPAVCHRGGAREDRVQITGVYGWPAVPMAIKQATAVMAVDIAKLKDAPFGVSGYGEYGAIRVRDNRSVRMLADPYKRCAVLVG